MADSFKTRDGKPSMPQFLVVTKDWSSVKTSSLVTTNSLLEKNGSVVSDNRSEIVIEKVKLRKIDSGFQSFPSHGTREAS